MFSGSLKDILYLRFRLLRRAMHRILFFASIRKAKSYIRTTHYQDQKNADLNYPSIIITNANGAKDFLILGHLLKAVEAVVAVPTELLSQKWITSLKPLFYVVPWPKNLSRYSLFRALLKSIRIYNRTLIVAAKPAVEYGLDLEVSYALLGKLAMKTNVPIVNIVFKKKKEAPYSCDLIISRRIFISPRTEYFKDIFFRRRGFRKFSQLNKSELNDIGIKLEQLYKEQLQETYG